MPSFSCPNNVRMASLSSVDGKMSVSRTGPWQTWVAPWPSIGEPTSSSDISPPELLAVCIDVNVLWLVTCGSAGEHTNRNEYIYVTNGTIYKHHYTCLVSTLFSTHHWKIGLKKVPFSVHSTEPMTTAGCWKCSNRKSRKWIKSQKQGLYLQTGEKCSHRSEGLMCPVSDFLLQFFRMLLVAMRFTVSVTRCCLWIGLAMALFGE